MRVKLCSTNNFCIQVLAICNAYYAISTHKNFFENFSKTSVIL